MFQIHLSLPCIPSQVIRLRKLKLKVVVLHVFPILKVVVSVSVCNILYDPCFKYNAMYNVCIKPLYALLKFLVKKALCETSNVSAYLRDSDIDIFVFNLLE